MRRALSLCLTLALCLAAVPAVAETELVVFAAASMTESLTGIAEMYKSVAPEVTLIFNFDSSGTLKTQLAEGAEADVFISAGQKQMDEIDHSANSDGLDLVLAGSRFDLLSNTVALVVPKGSERGIVSFEDAAGEKVDLMALGNSDVPVGQYAKEVFTSMGLWDRLNAEGKITFASNVKEVLAQVESAAVDCGVVYISDAAASDGVEAAAVAPAGSHQPVRYPAAVLKNAAHPDEAAAFLEYLKGDDCKAVFERFGFGVPER